MDRVGLSSNSLLISLLQKVNVPLQVQPQMFSFFSLISWGQILYYNQYVYEAA